MPENTITPIPGTIDYTQNFITEKIGLSFQGSPIDQFTNNILGRPDQETVKTDVAAYEIHGGPSDAIAFHDFHILKIAFEDVWQEVFDSSIPGLAQRLYEEYVIKQITYSGLQHPDSLTADQMGSVQELVNFITNLDASLNSLESNSVVDSKILELIPTLTNSVYARITETDLGLLTSWGNEYHNYGEAAWAFLGPTRIEQSRKLLRLKAYQLLLKYSGSDKILDIMVELQTSLAMPFKFDVFVPNSYNFGVLVTYSQQWIPGKFQVGDLITTIPLAPKESRKYSKKIVVKKSRQEKESENSLASKKYDSDTTARIDAEIVSKANNGTNFKLNAEGGFNIGIANARASTGVEIDAAKESSQTKKDFRESVIKASEEYKQEHKIDIESTASNEYEENTSGEITNPNDELTVTYLFYELQRQYAISEKLHKLTPAIMIAREVPTPDKIDEAWIIANDWIIKRVLLDDSFLDAINYIISNLEGDELKLKVLKNNLDLQTEIFNHIKSQIVTVSDTTIAALQQFDTAQSILINNVYNEAEEQEIQASQMQVETNRAIYDRAMADLNDLKIKLSQTMLAQQQATTEYSKALEIFLNKQQEILRLKTHLKSNILYYMHAIWDAEVPDQRFFTLYNIEICAFKNSSESIFDVGVLTDPINNRRATFHLPPPVLDESKTYKLHEIADIENVIGYKGNYQIFPLRINNPLTIHMMQEYIQIEDGEIGIHDPDILGGFNEDEFKAYVKRVYDQLGATTFNSTYKQMFENKYMQYLTSGYPESETIVLPTKSLYIEALPGKHPLLEDFKLAHRAMDVKKVQAEVRHAELENLRLASRLLNQSLDDADIDKKIVVEGGRDVIVTPTE